ncbi:TPA: DNA-directed RNA polymerase, partial [Candidatus Micrarchaeota archaeon]|nr:DNA-directed RNA polymerase [Candidatus Micrarchaeota archaeon]
MYYLKTIEERIRVPPEMFGSKLEDAVLRLLRTRFEGRIYRDIGMILSIDAPKVMTEGMVIPGDSGAYYTVRFDALTFLPFVNEVYLAEVKEIVEFGAFSSIGPFQGLLHVSQIGKDKYHYDKKSKTLTSRTAKRALKKGDTILVKVSTVSMKSSAADTKIGLTMRPDGLGKSEWMNPKKEAPKKKEKK